MPMRVARTTALFLGLGLATAIVLGANSPSATEGTAAATAAPVVFDGQADPQAPAARLARSQARESVASPRWSKHPIVLAVLAALLSIVGPTVRWNRFDQHAPRPLAPWRFRSGGRAPPPFQPSVA